MFKKITTPYVSQYENKLTSYFSIRLTEEDLGDSIRLTMQPRQDLYNDHIYELDKYQLHNFSETVSKEDLYFDKPRVLVKVSGSRMISPETKYAVFKIKKVEDSVLPKNNGLYLVEQFRLSFHTWYKDKTITSAWLSNHGTSITGTEITVRYTNLSTKEESTYTFSCSNRYKPVKNAIEKISLK